MRRLWLIAVLAACGGKPKASGPAWPAPSTTAEDGGESVEPRESSTVAAAIEKSEDPAGAKAEPKAAAEPKATTPGSEAKEALAPTGGPVPPIVEDVIISDEIIIEIDD